MAEEINKLARLFSPRSVAFIGGTIAEMCIRRSLELGYEGEIWPVHPRRESIEGFQCYRSIEDLPGIPDATHIGVNRHETIGIVRKLAEVGAGGCVCYAAGYAEMGEEGRQLETALIDAAGDMPLIGPNTFGFLNFLDRCALWPYLFGCQPVERGVAVISQSGNIAMNMTMNDRSVNFTHVIGTGNQSVMGQADLIDALLEDSRVRAIGMYVEGIDDMSHFAAAAARALEKGVAIVVLKVGKTEASVRQTTTHTSSLAGSDRLHDALFKRLGIIRVDTISRMLEVLKVLDQEAPLTGGNILSLSCSGGEASIMADLAAENGLQARDFSAALQRDLEAQFDSYVTVSNPFDYNTSIWGDRAAMEKCFTLAMSDDHDAAVLVWDSPNSTDPSVAAEVAEWTATMDAYIAAQQATGKQAFVLSSIPENLPRDVRERLCAHGIVPLQGLDDGIAAIAAVAGYQAHRRRVAGKTHLPRAFAAAAKTRPAWLDEGESKRRLAEFGLTVPAGEIVDTAQVREAAARAGFPVVLKAVGEDFLHKSELGAVKVGLANEDEVARGLEKIVEACAARQVTVEHFLVEQMVTGSLAELIVGIKRDDQFGPALLIGSGGILVEMIGDSISLLLPASREDVATALSSLKAAHLLQGYRGKPAGDLDACIDAICNVAAFAEAHWDSLLELDVNPLMVLEAGKGVVAADALICLDRSAGQS